MKQGRKRLGAGWVAALVLLLSIGCRPKHPPLEPPRKIDYSAPLPAGTLALEKIPPDQNPDFSQALEGANLSDLRRAIDNSLAYLARPGSQQSYPYLDIDHDRAVATLRAFRELMSAPPAGQRLNEAIAGRFEVYRSIGAPLPDGSGYSRKVLFTGYFTPTYDASLTRTGPYHWPLYKRPADLVSDESGEGAGRRDANGNLTAYPARREIESGLLAGQELAWVTSRWNAYVITIQGSARLRLPDGKIMEIGYAGTNGRAYSSPGQKMIEDGLIARDKISFQIMKRYFEAHPEAMDHYLWLHERTVFFTNRPGGPFGSLNVPVTPFCSIATDKTVYPPAMPAFVSVPTPADDGQLPIAGTFRSQTKAFNGFLLDQDRGGAIRSAGRCDIYMGVGERAEQTAGHQLNPGKLYYLALKPDLLPGATK